MGRGYPKFCNAFVGDATALCRASDQVHSRSEVVWTLARQFSPFRIFSAMFFPNLFLTEYYKDKLRTVCDSYLLKIRLYYCPINGWSWVSPCLDDLWFTCKGFALGSQRIKYFYTVEITTAQFPALPWLKSGFPAKSIPKNGFFFLIFLRCNFLSAGKGVQKMQTN